ncbi:MAG: phenylalanine--tRNA ligase subunit beta [Methylobacteriaceae bacterium]|nr:phenylalanine--tRNA ligase subunit beta [Methylobacteriaceae bacterium]
MKFTLSWLKEHIETEASLSDIVETLTRIGLEVERIENPIEKLKGFVVARVLDAKQHPNADRLRVCMVDPGSGKEVQVVCGAPNARSGMIGVFSPVGTYIPGKDITLTAGVIRGVESNGMLCSAAELEISDDHDGIIELAEDAPVGMPYAEYAGRNDPVIEINLTPNRPDATGIVGIARDLDAAGLGRLKRTEVKPVEGRFPCPVDVKLDFAPADQHLCPAFALRLVRGVKNAASPEWMQKRLRAIGLRPINALVDITNYVTFDRGRPLHVFDAKKVSGHLTVRRAEPGEKVLALDGRTYGLDDTMVVIADANGVESIAGIMGGGHSGCDETTTDVLIESALWDPLNIAETGRKLGINTDARYRFERGVDPAFCVPGAELATHLVLDLCGGEPSNLILAGKVDTKREAVVFPWSETARLTGLDIPTQEAARILEKLGFEIQPTPGNADRTYITRPTWRPDIEGKADLVEEIVRIAGLDRVRSVAMPRPGEIAIAVLTPLQRRTQTARRALAAEGLIEAVTWSFVSKAEAELFGGRGSDTALANPIASNLSDMRPSLLPGLIAAVKRNADRGAADVALFEVGQIFRGTSEKDQKIAATALRAGTAKRVGSGRHWSARADNADAFDGKGDALALLDALGIATGGLQVVPGGPAWFHPGRCGTLQFGPKGVIGYFGELHPTVIEALDAKGAHVGMEIVLDALPPAKARATKIRPPLDLPALMPLERDFAFIVDRGVHAADMIKAAQAADRTLVSDVSVFDVYEGQGIAEGKKSIALAVRVQPRDKTMTDAEIEALSQKIIGSVVQKTNATLRG